MSSFCKGQLSPSAMVMVMFDLGVALERKFDWVKGATKPEEERKGTNRLTGLKIMMKKESPDGPVAMGKWA